MTNKMNISVILATYNRCDSLRQCLDSLFSQTTDGLFDYEIVVVDNNSSDRTCEVVRSIAREYPGKVSYLSERKQGKSHALNAGIQMAKGEIFAFTDDDVRADPRWLINIVRCFETQHCDCVGGRILPVFPVKTPDWIKKNVEHIEGLLGTYDYGQETKKYQKPMYEFFGANFAFKRQVFDECGGFRTDVGPGTNLKGQDTSYINHILGRGKILYYCGQALVWHVLDKPVTLRYIARWHMALGRYRVRIDQTKSMESHLVYYLGVPRYLIRKIIAGFFRVVVNIFHKKKFLENCVPLFLDLGRALEIREIQRGKS